MWAKILHIIQKGHILKILFVFFHSFSFKTIRPVGKWLITLQSVFLWHSKWIIKELFREVSRIQSITWISWWHTRGDRYKQEQLSFLLKERVLFFCFFQAKFYPKSYNLSHLWRKKQSAVDLIWIVSFHRNSCRMLPLVWTKCLSR